MKLGQPIQSSRATTKAGSRSAPFWQSHLVLSVFVFLRLLISPAQCAAAEGSLSEYQVKALFLVNFAKYVEWPATAFADTNAPLVIGVIGEKNIGPPLEKAVEGKNVAGRAIQFLAIEKEDDLAKCHILFVSVSEKKHLSELLARVKELPVLTVGEAEPFISQGGVINFTKKEGKVRLQIDLEAARKAKLQLSSKLLSVADSITGR